jgi:nitronate monooxygenase
VEAAGVDTAAVGSLEASAIGASTTAPRRWKDVWSAGHTVSQVGDVPDVAELVERIAIEFAGA